MGVKSFVLGLVLVCLGGPVQALGCSCMGRGPCGGLGLDRTFFTGKVLTVATVDRPMGTFLARQRVYTIEVTEALTGSERVGERVQVQTGMGGGDCGYGFTVGESYLVDAFEIEGVLHTGICGVNAPLAEAVETLEELRTEVHGGRLPDLTGRVSAGLYGDFGGRALKGIAVTATDDSGAKLRTQTDGDGMYRWAVLAPGEYTLEVALPANLEPQLREEGKPLAITIPLSPEGSAKCHLDVLGLPAGRISGLVDMGGARLQLGLVTVWLPGTIAGQAPVTSVFVDGRDGSFALRYLPPGDYVLQLDLGLELNDHWFYPGVRERGSARIVHVDDGKAVTNLVFRAK